MAGLPDDTQIFLSKGGEIHGPFTPAQIEQMKASGEYATFAWIWEGHERGWVPLNRANSVPVAPSEADEEGHEELTDVFSEVPEDPTLTGMTQTGFTRTSATHTLTQPEFTLTDFTQTGTGTHDGIIPAKRRDDVSPAPKRERPQLPTSRPKELEQVQTQAPEFKASITIDQQPVSGVLSAVTRSGCIFSYKESDTASDEDAPMMIPEGTSLQLGIVDEISGELEYVEAMVQSVTLQGESIELGLSWNEFPLFLRNRL